MANYNDRRNNTRIEFKIEEQIGTLNHNSNTEWKKEVNIVRWNDGPSKLDIREWDADHQRMSKGVTFSEEETAKLVELLVKRFPEMVSVGEPGESKNDASSSSGLLDAAGQEEASA